MTNSDHYKSKLLAKLNPEIQKELIRVDLLAIEDKIAVFDMDGTLVEGDLGEAVFCYLKANEYPLGLKWSEYLKLLECGKHLEAYTEIIKSMKGINARSVMHATRNLLNSNSFEIHFVEDGIEYSYPIPKVISQMVNLIVYLKISGWSVSVISATSNVIVRVFTDNVLKLNPEFVRGIRSEFFVTDNYEDIFTDEMKGIITYGKGKTDTYNLIFGNKPPLITAGDSAGDIELINLTSPDGFALLCGKTKSNTDRLRAKISSQIQSINLIY